MEKLEKFQTLGLNHIQCSSVFGGTARDTAKYESGVPCTDCHDDVNDNGTIDAGECVTIEDCD